MHVVNIVSPLSEGTNWDGDIEKLIASVGSQMDQGPDGQAD
jgi:hypothetical protein